MADETVTEIEDSEPEGFGSAIDDATLRAMEEGATSKERGLSRRYALLAMARDANTLGQMSINNPKAYGAMREAIQDFEEHAQALLDVAKSASFRMYVCDCRDDAPALR